jgi:hypothetical protein
MSDHLAIATVTTAFGELISAPIKAAVTGAKVVHGRPDQVDSTKPGVGVHLYEIVRHAQFSGMDLPTRRSDGTVLQRPVLPLSLRYLLSFYGSETLSEPQRLLGVVLAILHEQPVLTPEHIDAVITSLRTGDPTHPLVESDLAAQAELVRLTPVFLSLDEMSKLWSIFYQTTYSLSIVYEASVVLIDGRISPQPRLPVREPRLVVVAGRGPRIERLESEAGGPPTATDTLLVHGEDLAGDGTRLQFADVEVEPTTMSPSRLTLELPSSGVDLRAGIHGLRVVRRLDPMGTSSNLALESNVVPFVLHPTITVPASAPTTASTVHLDVTPPLRAGQSLTLSLNGDRDYLFEHPRAPADTSRVSVGIRDVAAGTYLVRLTIDGAQSLLAATAGGFTGPTVIVP